MRTMSLVAVLLLTACHMPSEHKDSAAAAPGDASPHADAAHNSRNSLDWAGTYSGVVPCADCEGIRTTVTLNADGTFERELVYLGRSAGPLRDAGRFTWNEAGSVVTLVPPEGTTQMYQVGENRLFHLDQAGNRIGGELAERYVLTQAVHDPRIEGRKWLLVEVMGQPYTPPDGSREAFILLDGEHSRISGNNSCNNFFSAYNIESGQRIHFGEIMGTTMMACPDVTTEPAFMEALAKVDNYAVDGNQLSLNRARMAPLLRFEVAVEME